MIIDNGDEQSSMLCYIVYNMILLLRLVFTTDSVFDDNLIFIGICNYSQYI